jgi:predicted transcriptional regulator
MNGLRKEREKRGLSQTKFARLLGLSNGYVSKIEAGIVIPPCWTRAKIAAVLNLSQSAVARLIGRRF